MQGASLLAASKPVDNDSSHSLFSNSTPASNRDLFKNCLRKQTRDMDQSYGQSSTSNGQTEGKPAKLDRSALLRSPDSTRLSEQKLEREAQDVDTLVLNTVSEIQPSEASGQKPGDEQTGDRADTLTPGISIPTADQAYDSGSTWADEALPALEILLSMVNVAEQSKPQQEIELSVNTITQPGLDETMTTGETGQALLDTSTAVVQQNLLDVPLVEHEMTLPLETNPVQIQSIQSKPEVSLEALQVTAEALPAPAEKHPQVTETQVAADQTVSSSGDESPTVLEKLPLTLSALTEQEPPASLNSDPVAAMPVVEDAEAIAHLNAAQVPSGENNQSGIKPVADKSAGAVLTASESHDSSTGSAQAELADSKASAAAGNDKADSKVSLEVLKALAGKLNESNGKKSTPVEKTADISDSKSDGALKKIMEFENGRLQASRLNPEITETKATDSQLSGTTSDNGDAITSAQTAEVKITGEFSKALTAEFTGKTPVDVKSIIDQVVQKAELIVKANSSEMKIQLEPEFLGKMTIKIALEDGLLTARFITENHQVKHLLENNMASLRQSLEAQGIRVEKTEVNVQLESGGTFGGYQEGRQEMWQRPENPGYQNSGNLDTGTYSLRSDEELAEPAFVPTEYYGVQADGSMNFII
ncbi:MAG: hypothetical protein GXY34_01815 [Syntrophomonadaceae bacterium]|nr:hypothetical protein [Syntrophomonadaceae bacterium]